MVKPSPRIDGMRVIEPHGMPDVLQQKVAASEVGDSGGHKDPLLLRRR
jgi:hypothetical protein